MTCEPGRPANAWVTRNCLCGGSMRAKSTPALVAMELAERFDELHSGDGHGPATAKQSAQARATVETVGADT